VTVVIPVVTIVAKRNAVGGNSGKTKTAAINATAVVTAAIKT